MSNVRKIARNPKKAGKNYFIVDACFLANKYLSIGTASGLEADIIRHSHKWWKEIDRQVGEGRARVYIPDLCIAETFKVLAKKYYQEDRFRNNSHYNSVRDKLSDDISLSHKELQKQNRYIGYHDVPATRDIIVAVGRFYELFMKHECNVQIVDLILVSTAKYLMDFHDAKRSQLHIITHDKALWKGTKKVTELPNAYDPAQESDEFERVFD